MKINNDMPNPYKGNNLIPNKVSCNVIEVHCIIFLS